MTIDITVPRSWHELTPRQARWLLRTIARNPEMGAFRLKAIAFLRFSGLRVITRATDSDTYLVQKGPIIFELDPERFAACVRSMDWAVMPPHSPWRPRRIAGGRPAWADLTDITFDTFLQLENLYIGYLQTQKPELLRLMGSLLIRRRWKPYTKADLTAIFFWYQSAKTALQARYPDFFSGVSAQDSVMGHTAITREALERTVNAQIRALTKGDITKETQVLEMPCHRALAELNALAAEYAELERQRQKS